jgi:hypothetical protein
VLDHDLVDAVRRREVDKNVVRSKSGRRTETLYHGADSKWALTFAPARGEELEHLREFLDSTAEDEPFLLWLYGTEAEPLEVVRDDDGYAFSAFMRTGDRDTDAFTLSISVAEL